MVNYYIEKDNKIIRFDTSLEQFNLMLKYRPDLQGLEIKETERPLALSDDGTYYIFADTDEYIQEQAQKERQRLNMLNLTKADVLLALYEDKGITPDNIKEMLKDNVPALIKFDYASSYYRGDEVVNALGLALGYSTEEMDYLFENKKFPEKTVEPVEPADTDNDSDTDNDIDSDADNDTDTDVEPEA